MRSGLGVVGDGARAECATLHPLPAEALPAPILRVPTIIVGAVAACGFDKQCMASARLGAQYPIREIASCSQPHGYRFEASGVQRPIFRFHRMRAFVLVGRGGLPTTYSCTGCRGRLWKLCAFRAMLTLCVLSLTIRCHVELEVPRLQPNRDALAQEI